MNFPTKTVFAAVLAVAGLVATAESSSAMPRAHVAPGAAPLVQDVRWGCGRGWHPNPWGRCVPDRRPIYGYGHGPRPRYWGEGPRPRHWGGPEYRPYPREYRY